MLLGQGSCKVLERNRTTGREARTLGCHDGSPSRGREMRVAGEDMIRRQKEIGLSVRRLALTGAIPAARLFCRSVTEIFTGHRQIRNRHDATLARTLPCAALQPQIPNTPAF